MPLRDVIGPALDIARHKPAHDRKDCSLEGLVHALNEFETQSKVDGRVRSFDGLNAIDTAVANLKSWRISGAVTPLTQDAVAALLSACADWLRRTNTNPTRHAAVSTLYWKVAWAYSSARFVLAAQRAIAAHQSGPATSLVDPPLNNLEFGNPYEVGTDYVKVHPAPLVYRGDSRSPQEIRTANGFVAPNVANADQFQPWWDGHSVGGTQSATADIALAFNAATASSGKGLPPPAWLLQLVTPKTKTIRGYVYEMKVGGSTGLIMAPEPREISYLAIPRTCLTRFWVITKDQSSLGPFIFPVTPVASGNPGWASRLQLHGI